jgi:hypothetical protein
VALLLNLQYLPFTTLLVSEYQDPVSTILTLSPELVLLFIEYFNTFIIYSLINNSPSIIFDLYSDNLNFFYSEGCIQFLYVFIYIYFIVYSFSTTFLLKWVNFYMSHFLRFYYYFYSISKETRIQFEVVTQTMVFFLIY